MSEPRRLAVAEIARRHNVWIIEDDAYGLLPASAPRTLAELAPELTFYVSGLAKFVGAGLRVAYLAAPGTRQAQPATATGIRTSARKRCRSPFRSRHGSSSAITWRR